MHLSALPCLNPLEGSEASRQADAVHRAHLSALPCYPSFPCPAPPLAHLQERLDLAPLCELLGSHPLCDFTRVAVYTSDDSMGVWAGLGTLVRSLEDHGFAAGVASREDDADLRDKGNTRRLSVCCTLARYACC